MDSYRKYIESVSSPSGDAMLDIVGVDQKYQIFQGPEPLLTKAGHPFVHDTERVAQLMVTELMLPGRLQQRQMAAPFLFSYQKDIFEPGGDPVEINWNDMISKDPIVAVKSEGKFGFQSYHVDDELFSFSFIALSSLIRDVNHFVNISMSELDVQESESQPFTDLLQICYRQLPVEKKIIVQVLSELHQSGITLPLVLISGMISPLGYAKGLVALKISETQGIDDILLDIISFQDYLVCLEHQPGGAGIWEQVVRQGENEVVEFKSTLRWDIRAGKTNQAVERACLKTMAAFLNSTGGNLLIGVRDDGSIEGIETDKFVNDDKFLLHLWTLIRTCLGRDASPYLRTTLEKTGDKTVCMVHCRPAPRPVFLRQPGFPEEFYIRVGPSSNAMDVSEALKYIGDRFA